MKQKEIISNNLYESDFYNLKNWEFGFDKTDPVHHGYNDCFCVVFVKKGQYLFGQSLKQYEMHTGHIIIEKGNYEYAIKPSCGGITIFNFTNDFYQQFIDDMNLKNEYFFSNPNIISTMLLATSEMEYLHYQIIQSIAIEDKFIVDTLVLEFLENIVAIITNQKINNSNVPTYTGYHLTTIEEAKAYMFSNFATNISLEEISKNCHISMFHFSRLFKQITGYTATQFLNNIRLKHGEILLRNTTMPIAEIGYACGYNSLEYFTTSFKRRYGKSAGQYRQG